MNTAQAIGILNNLSINEDLSVYERSAINEAIMTMEHTKRMGEVQNNFQGRSIEKLTMKELRKFVKENGALHDEAKLLVLQDDGTGYGANNGYCSGLYVSKDENNDTTVQIWF